MYYKYFTLFFCLPLACFAQSAHSLLREGNVAYKKGDYANAERNYHQSLQQNATVKSTYNLGNAVFAQQRMDEAIKHYETVVANTKDNQIKADANYNLGNAFFQKKEFAKSIEAYKNTLRLRPNDLQAKQNLVLARQQQAQQQQKSPQQKEQNKDNKQPQNQDKNNNQDNNKENMEQNQENKDNKSPQQNNDSEQKQNQPKDNPTQEQPKSSSASKEEARRMLEIMDKEEQKVQQKMRRNGKPTKGKKQSSKDW